MEAKIVEEKQDIFFGRKVLIVELLHQNEPTPSRKQVEEWVSKKLGIDASHIQVDYIRTRAARCQSKAKVFVYNHPIKKGEANEAQTQ